MILAGYTLRSTSVITHTHARTHARTHAQMQESRRTHSHEYTYRCIHDRPLTYMQASTHAHTHTHPSINYFAFLCNAVYFIYSSINLPVELNQIITVGLLLRGS